MRIEGQSVGAEVAGQRLAAGLARWEAAYELWLSSVEEHELGLLRADRERVMAHGDASVRVSRLALAEESKRLVFYGPLGAELAGLGVAVAELRRLARRPAKMLSSGQSVAQTGEGGL